MKMASTVNQWATVRKTGKKSKGPASNGLSKEEKKTLMDNMPRLQKSNPVQESSTIYDAFAEKTVVVTKPEKPTGNGTTQHVKKAGGTPKGKQMSGDKPRPTDMDEAIKQIQVEELQAVLTKVQATFPENPSVWLKDLASILNLKMDQVPETDPVFQGRPHNYPLCMLPNPVRKLLNRTINQCNKQILQHFLEHCIQSMVADLKQGVSTYGYRMFIQLLVHDKPDLIIPTMHKYQELMKANQNRALRCLSIMWAVGQAGFGKLEIGIKVWFDVMFITLNVRALSGYCVQYIENLFKLHTNLQPAMNMIKVKDFFHVLDVFYTPQASLPSSLQKRLQAIFPHIQKIAFGSKPENHLRLFFPHYFTRVTSTNKYIQQEALSGLVNCLSVDISSFSEWRQMYTKDNLHKSGILLQHICKKWTSVTRVVDKKKLLETIRSFDVTNEDMAGKENVHDIEGYQMCRTNCKEVLTKMGKTSFPWKWLFFLVAVILGGLLAYDVHLHKGYQKSKSYRVLKDTGILFYLEQVFRRCQIYSSKALVWLRENVPYYYGKVCEFVGPYLQLFWEKLYDLAMYLVELSKPVRAWLDEKIPLVLEWAQEKFPTVWETTKHYLYIVWTTIVIYSLMVWQFIVYYLNIAGTWLMENVFVGSFTPENILQTLSGWLVTLQLYIQSFIQWITNYISGPASTDTVTSKQQ